MIRKVDLHTHSSVSDGQHHPRDLARLAVKAGLEVLALTDHDTIDGLNEVLDEGSRLGLKVLGGVELGAQEHRHLHILGYGFSLSDGGLLSLCQKLRGGRDERKYRIIDFLREKGVDLSLAEVEELAGGDVIARPHFAQIMVRRGYVANTREAFDQYLDTDEYQRIERFKADARTCIETIKGAGGYVSLAHPYQLGMAEEELDVLVGQLRDYGLDAMECYYSRHTPEQQTSYLRLAEKYGLRVTGGSDFHGDRVKPDVALTPYKLEIDWLLEKAG